MRRSVSAIATGLAVSVAWAWGLGGSAEAGSTGVRIVVTTTIQAAVDAAEPGDTVVVPAGVYRETVVVRTSEITITGNRGAILDASGFPTGITASSGRITRPEGVPTCPAASLHDIVLRGLTIRNASFTGVLFRGVDRFEVSGGRYRDNHEYAIFPICSRDGLIAGNDAQGSQDAALYVGDSEAVTLDDNRVTRSTVGVEIENSSSIVVTGSRLTGNTAGIVAFVLPGLPIPFTRDVLIANNLIASNNVPNPVLPTDGPVGRIPTGTGVLSIGADDVSIENNTVVDNNSGGIAVLANPLAGADPRVDAEPDDHRLLGNRVHGNGLDPDEVRSRIPGADLIYDGTGSGNCFAENVFDTEFPVGTTTAFDCPQR